MNELPGLAAAWLPSFLIWRLLGVGKRAYALSVPLRYALAALLFAFWGALHLEPMRMAALCLFWGVPALEAESRRSWAWVSALALCCSLYVESLLGAYHGLGARIDLRIFLACLGPIMLSLKGILNSSLLTRLLFYSLGILACL